MYQIGNDYHAWLEARRAQNSARRMREAMLIIAIALAILVLVLTTGCAPVDICAELRAGASLVQTSDNPQTFDLLRRGIVIQSGVTMEQIQKCGK